MPENPEYPDRYATLGRAIFDIRYVEMSIYRGERETEGPRTGQRSIADNSHRGNKMPALDAGVIDGEELGIYAKGTTCGIISRVNEERQSGFEFLINHGTDEIIESEIVLLLACFVERSLQIGRSFQLRFKSKAELL